MAETDPFDISTDTYDPSRFQSAQGRLQFEDKSARAMREHGLTGDHREALDRMRATPIGGPTGHGDPDLDDLTIEQLQERLKAQTTDSQAYWDRYGMSPEGHIER